MGDANGRGFVPQSEDSRIHWRFHLQSLSETMGVRISLGKCQVFKRPGDSLTTILELKYTPGSCRTIPMRIFHILERFALGVHADSGTARLPGSRGTRLAPFGHWWDLHPRALRAFACFALAFQAVYLTWRIGWSAHGAEIILWSALLLTELFGIFSLATLTYYSWTRKSTMRPFPTPGRSVDVFICTYDEPIDVIRATVIGAKAIRYPHVTYLLDDGHRSEVKELAERLGVLYLAHKDNTDFKAGNINAGLAMSCGEFVFILDADHVPMPDALDALVGYFDNVRVALVQSPHDFYNQDSFQHYTYGRHEQSLFYHVILPGKDRAGSAYWCGSAALLRRSALESIGGVATETIAEDFHTTLRLLSAKWETRYHDEILVQGIAPADINSYLIQRDRWARGNLAVLRTKENPIRVRRLSFAQRIAFMSSLISYLAGPMRLVLLGVLATTLWTGWLPMHFSTMIFLSLWGPSVILSVAASSALARGYMRSAEAVHFELCTGEIYLRALKAALTKSKSRPNVTLKPGPDNGGWNAVRKLHLVDFFALALSVGVIARSASDVFGLEYLPSLPGITAAVVPILALFELRRVLRTLTVVTQRRQRRSEYRFESELKASLLLHREGVDMEVKSAKTIDIGLFGARLQLEGTPLSSPLIPGETATLFLELPESEDKQESLELFSKIVSVTDQDGVSVAGMSILDSNPETQDALAKWCFIHFSYRRLRDFEPSAATASLRSPYPKMVRPDKRFRTKEVRGTPTW